MAISLEWQGSGGPWHWHGGNGTQVLGGLGIWFHRRVTPGEDQEEDKAMSPWKGFQALGRDGETRGNLIYYLVREAEVKHLSFLTCHSLSSGYQPAPSSSLLSAHFETFPQGCSSLFLMPPNLTLIPCTNSSCLSILRNPSWVFFIPFLSMYSPWYIRTSQLLACKHMNTTTTVFVPLSAQAAIGSILWWVYLHVDMLLYFLK